MDEPTDKQLDEYYRQILEWAREWAKRPRYYSEEQIRAMYSESAVFVANYQDLLA